MAKVGAVVSRALRLLRVIDQEEGPQPHQYSTAIEALNAMCARWEADGIAIGWVAVSNPDEELPAPDEALEAVAFNLAVKLRPEYGANLDPDVLDSARMTYADVLRDFAVAFPIRSRSNAPEPEAEREYTDIRTG